VSIKDLPTGASFPASSLIPRRANLGSGFPLTPRLILEVASYGWSAGTA